MSFIPSIASACIEPVANILALPSSFSKRVCFYFAEKSVDFLSYSSYLTPSFVKRYYHTLCERKAYTVITQIEPYLKAHPGLISLLFCAKAYQEKPNGWRKIAMCARAVLSVIESAMAWCSQHVPRQQGGTGRYDAQKRKLAQEVIAYLVSSSYKNSVKIITQYSVSYLYQIMIGHAVIQGLNQISPAIYRHYSQADQTVRYLRWTLRAYFYLPVLYQLGASCYRGYRVYRQLEEVSSTDLMTRQFNLPHHLPRFVTAPLSRLHALLLQQLPLLRISR